MAGEGHNAINKNELCVAVGHLPEVCENLGGVGIGPIVHNVLEEENRSILYRLRLEEIVNFDPQSQHWRSNVVILIFNNKPCNVTRPHCIA